MKKLLLLVLCLGLSVLPALAQTCTITQGTQIPVNSNDAIQLTASGCGSGLTWSLNSGGQGSISTGGFYVAPSYVTVHNQSRGCQIVPNNSVFNTPVDTLPVDPHSTTWLNRALEDSPLYGPYHNWKVYAGEPLVFFDNPVDHTTPTQLMHFYYPSLSMGYQDTYFPMPTPRNVFEEGGQYLGWSGPFVTDRHIMTVNKETCDETEIYYNYPDYRTVTITAGNPTQLTWTTNTIWPIANKSYVSITGATGGWTGINQNNWVLTVTGTNTGTIPFNSTGLGSFTGTPVMTSLATTQEAQCQNCNAQGGQHYSPKMYQLNGGTDAAGLCLGCLTPKVQEWYSAVQQGKSDLGHAVRATFSTQYPSARNIWPATSYALFIGGFQIFFPGVGCTPGNPTVCPVVSHITPALPCDQYAYTNAASSVSIGAAGSGYYVGDIVYLNGTNTSVQVTAVDSSHHITGIALDHKGSGVSTGTYATTTSGGGSGATIVINSIAGTCSFPIHVFGLDGTPWAGMDGDQTATSVLGNDEQVTIAFNSNGLTGFPASGAYFVPDFFPYGARLRMKASVDPTYSTLCTTESWCPYAKVYLNTLRKYGAIVDDTVLPGGNWGTNIVDSEFYPKDIIDATTHIRSWSTFQPVENSLEVVDESSLQVPGLSTTSAGWQATNVNRTVATVCGSSGCASSDILLQGTTIGTDRERFTQVAGSTYQINAWVNGNKNAVLAYSYNPSDIPGWSVSSSSLVTMPNCNVSLISPIETGIITVTNTNDPTARPLYIKAMCLPMSADGGYRVALGNYNGNFQDSHGMIWWGALAAYGFNNQYEAPEWSYAVQNGSISQSGNTWATSGIVDYQLYAFSLSASNDIKLELVGLPNGTYNAVLYGEPGYGTNGPNQCVYDLQVQGTIIANWQDCYVLAGNRLYNGYNTTFTAVVTDNVLSVTGRDRQPSIEGMSLSSLVVYPSTIPIILNNSLPNGTELQSYSASLSIVGGTSPYTCSESGSLPPGLSLNSSTCVISGTPTAHGSWTATYNATDSLHIISPPVSLTITVSPPVITVSGSLPNGTRGVPYGPYSLSASGGYSPYTYSIAFGSLPPGLSLSSAGVVSGTPTTTGTFLFSVKATDAHGNTGSKVYTIKIASPGASANTHFGLTSRGITVP